MRFKVVFVVAKLVVYVATFVVVVEAVAFVGAIFVANVAALVFVNAKLILSVATFVVVVVAVAFLVPKHVDHVATEAVVA